MTAIKELTTEDLLYNARENNKKLKQEINKYKQALEEIREIAKEITNKQIFKNNVYENLDTKGKRILDKINEVLNDRN